MIDPVIIAGEEEDDWKLDIDIINGWLREVPSPNPLNTNQQRKALLAYQIRGTIPGDEERGVAWGAIISNPKATMADAMMETQLALQADEGSSADGSFAIPLIAPTEDGGMNFNIITVSMDDIDAIVQEEIS